MLKKLSVLTFVFAVLIVSVLGSKKASSKSDVIEITENNFVIFNGEVNSQSVAKASAELGALSSRLDEDDVIYLIINSPGGSVSAGKQFISFGQGIPQKIKTISLFAASMGFHFSQGFDERLVLSSSLLMSHRASVSGMSGQIPGELDRRIAMLKDLIRDLDEHAAKRASISLKAYADIVHDELWLTGKLAVQDKFADRLVLAKCSKELLNETTTEQFDVPLFGSVDVTLSKCPLITGAISAKLSKGNNTVVQGMTEQMLINAYNNRFRGVSKMEM